MEQLKMWPKFMFATILVDCTDFHNIQPQTFDFKRYSVQFNAPAFRFEIEFQYAHDKLKKPI